MSKTANSASPCPFCGGTDIRVYQHEGKHGDQWWNIFCHDCSAELKYADDEFSAIFAWNKRITTTISKPQAYTTYLVEGQGAFGGTNFQLITECVGDMKEDEG